MFCGKCGTRNVEGAKFCENCGEKLEEYKSDGKLKQIKNKFHDLPKKSKIIMATVLGVVIVSIVVLAVLLNNPEKKVSDKLASYYTNYKENYTAELETIGDVLKNNKKNDKTLNRIKEDSKRIITNWVKNFNTTYKDKEDLDTNYKKVSGVLFEIYRYFNGLDYILSENLYRELNTELSSVYTSKVNYLYGVNAQDNYSKYSYFQRVIKEDSYYKKAQEFVQNYVADEVKAYKEKADAFIKFETDASDADKLQGYLEQLGYLNDNKIVNSIDISGTEEYQKLYDAALKNVISLTKKRVEDLEKSLDYGAALEVIKEALEEVPKDNDEYKTLEDLEKDLEKNKPDLLVDKFVVDYKNSYDSPYDITINDEKYDNYINFSFEGKTAFRTYRLNNEYKKLKAKIVVGPNWPSDFSGEIVISSKDKELFRSGKITKSSEFTENIEIDITDIDDLKIEFVTTNDDGWENFYVYLVEPYLYK